MAATIRARPNNATRLTFICVAQGLPNPPVHVRQAGRASETSSRLFGVPLGLVAQAEIHDALDQNRIFDAFGQGALREIFGFL